MNNENKSPLEKITLPVNPDDVSLRYGFIVDAKGETLFAFECNWLLSAEETGDFLTKAINGMASQLVPRLFIDTARPALERYKAGEIAIAKCVELLNEACQSPEPSVTQENNFLIPFPKDTEDVRGGREIGIWMRGWELGYRSKWQSPQVESTEKQQPIRHNFSYFGPHNPIMSKHFRQLHYSRKKNLCPSSLSRNEMLVRDYLKKGVLMRIHCPLLWPVISGAKKAREEVNCYQY